MPSFADSIFLFVLALLLFGPKKLPVLARELGKWVGEFRRASNEFKFQMEEELRASEQADRRQQIAAMEAAAPLPPPLDEPEHPHLRSRTSSEPDASQPAAGGLAPEQNSILPGPAPESGPAPEQAANPSLAKAEGVSPVPIATSGSLQMMPPATGLPTPRPRNLPAAAPPPETDAVSGMLGAIPSTSAPAPYTDVTPERIDELTRELLEESAAHGD